jgi:hypothetical protein
MNAFTGDLYDVLEAFVLSPWNVLKVECGWRGVDPCNIQRDELAWLVPALRAHVARVTDDENGDACAAALLALLQEPSSSRPPTAPVIFDY